MYPVNPLSGNVPYFIILLCLTPDDLTRQGESAATQWVNQTLPMHPVNPLSGNAPGCVLLYYFTLSNTRQFYSSGEECCHSMGYIITIGPLAGIEPAALRFWCSTLTN